ncbi:GntR family transcriptional regulator [Lentibacillus halophilus]|uniref:GntR family transcriptional regulator n=1 Tax=Lentibacillus halophilus TaxID=295065 RepID=A0ABN0ZGM7_9BACI
MHQQDSNGMTRKSLSGFIADQLKSRIWNKEIQLGERLLESDLAYVFDVSRSTIREALISLESEGIAVSHARKGTYVASFSQQDIDEIIELRTLLEKHAFAQAYYFLEKHHVNDLQAVVDQMKTKADESNWNALFNLDMQFHNYVVRMCGNSRMINIYDSLQVQIRTYLMHIDQYYSSYHSFYDEHKQLLQALVSNDVNKVKRGVRHHIKYVETKLLGKRNKEFEEV